MILVRQKAWLIVLVALFTGAVVAASATALRPTRYAVELAVPPVATAAMPGPERSPDPAGLAGRGELVAETIRVLGLEIEPSELAARIESDFDRDSRVLEITITRLAGQPTEAIAERVAVRVAEEWNQRLAAVRSFYSAALERRDRLSRLAERASRQLADAAPPAAGPLFSGVAEAEAEIGRLNEQLLGIGRPERSAAFILEEPSEVSPWTGAYAAIAFVAGALAGALLTILALLGYSRRRASRASTAS